jgi:hypothetical protein
VDVVDLEQGRFHSLPLGEFLQRIGRKLPGMGKIFSVYRDHQILPMVGIMPNLHAEDLVVTFNGLTGSGFPSELKSILDILQDGLGEPVDVEFAHDGESFYMLQCRSLSLGPAAQRVQIPWHVPSTDRVFSADRYVQMAQVRNLEYVVLVDPRDYERLPSRDRIYRVARAVGALNRALPERAFALMGPGRWGSRGDIRLGIPVTYSDICHTAMLVEIARKKGSYLPEVSFGTHFFNDLVESKIAYLPLYPDDDNVIWNEAYLNDAPNVLADLVEPFADLSDVVRVIHVPAIADGRLLHVVMDSEEDAALGYLAPPI